MLEAIIAVVVWAVVRSFVAKSAREKAQRQKAERGELTGGFAPNPAKPSRPSRPRGWGEWAEMLGQMADGEPPVFKKPTAPPEPWANEAAFPPPAPSAFKEEPISKELISMRPVSSEGVDECHEAMLTGPAPETPEPDSLPVRFDAPSLVKGVIFAEILTRPVLRRRPGMPPS